MNNEIDFDDMSEPAEDRPAKDGGQRKGGIMFLQAPALNSIELAIRAKIAQQPLLIETSIAFVDEDGNTEGHHRNEFSDATLDTPERARLRNDIFGALSEHAALARSLGTAGTWQQYVDACNREKMSPLALADYRR
jgi:hypothetical protein